jgi:hypothetical protein
MSSEINGWSHDVENLLFKIAYNCEEFSRYHRKAYFSFKEVIKYFAIPIIALSTINSVIGPGLQPYLAQQYITLIVTVINMLISLLGSMQLFLGISENIKAEEESTRNFSLLSIEITTVLHLNRENRTRNGLEFKDEQYTKYVKYVSEAKIPHRKFKNILMNIPGITSYSSDAEISLPDISNPPQTPYSVHRNFSNQLLEEDPL